MTARTKHQSLSSVIHGWRLKYLWTVKCNLDLTVVYGLQQVTVLLTIHKKISFFLSTAVLLGHVDQVTAMQAEGNESICSSALLWRYKAVWFTTVKFYFNKLMFI